MVLSNRVYATNNKKKQVKYIHFRRRLKFFGPLVEKNILEIPSRWK